MVKAIIDISEHSNWMLNMVKAKYKLRTKSEAIDKLFDMFDDEELGLELRPEFVRKIKAQEKEKGIPIKDFAKHYGLK
jgi:hypothetical protein